jgi:hypothetical protein
LKLLKCLPDGGGTSTYAVGGRTTWEALSAVHDEVTSVDEDIPEPDWAAFRSSVRDQLFARSVQREASMRRWAGWAMRPSAAWALSVMLSVGIPAGAFLWHLKDHNAEFIGYEMPKPGSPAELIEAGTDKTVFDDLMQLTESEVALEISPSLRPSECV